MPKSFPSTESTLYLRSIFFLKTASERFEEEGAGAMAIGGRVLHAVGYPKIGERRLAEGLADGGADSAATDAVLDPELADRLVGVGERQAVGGQRMGEIRLVEIETDVALLAQAIQLANWSTLSSSRSTFLPSISA